MSAVRERELDLIINIPQSAGEEELTNDYLVRRAAVDFNIPLITNLQLAERFVDAVEKLGMEDLAVKSWDEY